VDAPDHRADGYRAGWYPDPLGRFDHRWYDGTRWTADVSLDGVRRVDPAGIAHGAGTESADRPRRRVPRIVIVLGAITLGSLVVGAVVVWSAVADFIRVADHDVALVECGGDGSSLSVTVDLTNTGTRPASYTVFVEVTGEPLDRTLRSITLTADDVVAGATETLSTSVDSTFTDVECTILGVLGPLPFGIDLGPVGSSP
jgi:hypothetical protein